MPTTHTQDQASGLRQRTGNATHAAVPALPLLYADFVLFRGVALTLPPQVLVWHWRAHALPAAGLDAHARLHVVGSPIQFDAATLSQWRTRFSEWHLVGRHLQILQVADIARLWLTAGVPLLTRLKPLLAWLSRNHPEMPIIFAGIGSGAAQRLQMWAYSRYPLRCLTPTQEIPKVQPQGYYRLLRVIHEWRSVHQDYPLGG